MVAPLPVREFTSVAEMQAHYAAVRRRIDEGRTAPKPALAPTAPRKTPSWSAPLVVGRIKLVTPGQLAGAQHSAGDCLRIAAAATGLTQKELCCESRKAKLVKGRQIAFWLMARIGKRSLPDVGRRIGGRDHTTVLHGVRRVERIAKHLRIPLNGDAAEIAASLWAADWSGGSKLGSAA